MILNIDILDFTDIGSGHYDKSKNLAHSFDNFNFLSFDYCTSDLEQFWILFQINGGVESQKFCIRECEWMNSAKPFNLSFLYLYLFVYCTKRIKSFFTITYFNFDDTKEKEDLPHCHCGPLEFLCE